ncbi:hypothetical protein E2320_017969 [Naja naja]|nr:hypothetical protein E2320_017969 [Naja naja]
MRARATAAQLLRWPGGTWRCALHRTEPEPVMVGAIPRQPRRFWGVAGWQVSPASFTSHRRPLQQEDTPARGQDPVQWDVALQPTS